MKPSASILRLTMILCVLAAPLVASSEEVTTQNWHSSRMAILNSLAPVIWQPTPKRGVQEWSYFPEILNNVDVYYKSPLESGFLQPPILRPEIAPEVIARFLLSIGYTPKSGSAETQEYVSPSGHISKLGTVSARELQNSAFAVSVDKNQTFASLYFENSDDMRLFLKLAFSPSHRDQFFWKNPHLKQEKEMAQLWKPIEQRVYRPVELVSPCEIDLDKLNGGILGLVPRSVEIDRLSGGFIC